jgi:hypothetical protein
MNRQQNLPEPHPLKEMFRSRKITLWMIRNITGIVEPQLSRYFNRIDPIPSQLENNLYKLFYTMDNRPDVYEELHEISLRATRKMQEDNEALVRKGIEQKSKEEQS